MTKLKKLPEFKTEEEEILFWETHSMADYFDWSRSERVVFPNLKPSVKTISIRLPESMIDSLKYLSNKMDVPYQTLIKNFLYRDIIKELNAHKQR